MKYFIVALSIFIISCADRSKRYEFENIKSATVSIFQGWDIRTDTIVSINELILDLNKLVEVDPYKYKAKGFFVLEYHNGSKDTIRTDGILFGPRRWRCLESKIDLLEKYAN